jgi:hypothetical protein
MDALTQRRERDLLYMDLSPGFQIMGHLDRRVQVFVAHVDGHGGLKEHRPKKRQFLVESTTFVCMILFRETIPRQM